VNDNGELDVLLDGFKTQAERDAIRTAYHDFAQSDPRTFPAQFAVLLQAHNRALTNAPDRFRRTLADEAKAIAATIATQRATLKEWECALKQSAAVSAEQVERIRESISVLTETVQRSTALTTAALNEATKQSRRTEELAGVLTRISARQIAWGYVLAFASGVIVAFAFVLIMHHF
jgi:hypothetical protein